MCVEEVEEVVVRSASAGGARVLLVGGTSVYIVWGRTVGWAQCI